MADTSQGAGWWQATDGKFYPPEQNPMVAPPPVKKKVYKRVWFWLLVVVAVGIGGCTALIAGGTAAVDHAAHQTHTIVYSVTGSGQATDITYDTIQQGSGQNGESQLANVNLPWTMTIKASGLITSYTVSGTIGQNGGTLTCRITEDGRQLATNTASGAFATASCSSAGT